MTIGEHLLQVADAGLAISDTVTDENVFEHLQVLLAIEDTLDKGRFVVGFQGSGNEHIPEINKRMDLLRSKISAIIDRCDVYEYRQFMDIRIRALQQSFKR